MNRDASTRNGESIRETVTPYLTTEAFEWSDSQGEAISVTSPTALASPWQEGVESSATKTLTEADIEAVGVGEEMESEEYVVLEHDNTVEETDPAGRSLDELITTGEFESSPSGCDPPTLDPAIPAPRSKPQGHCVPFAGLPPEGSFWPLVTAHPRGEEVPYEAESGRTVGNGSRAFLASRGKRYHAAIDLYANYGDPVVACEKGKIVAFYGFCCKEKKTSHALLVEHSGVVVNYGEVHPDSPGGRMIGAEVHAGEIIAHIGRNPNGSSMLHFETYVLGTRRNEQWLKGRSRPLRLLNPTAYLLALRARGRRGNASGSTASVSATTHPISSSTGIDVARAVSRNAVLAESLGWRNRFDEIVRIIGFSGFTPNQESFAEAVARWQRANGLTVDGIVGPATWAALQRHLPASRPSAPSPMPEETVDATPEADRELGSDRDMPTTRAHERANDQEIRDETLAHTTE